MTKPTERDQETIGQAIDEFANHAIQCRDGLPDFWDENNTTERLSEHLAPLLAAARDEGRRAERERCWKLCQPFCNSSYVATCIAEQILEAPQ